MKVGGYVIRSGKAGIPGSMAGIWSDSLIASTTRKITPCAKVLGRNSVRCSMRGRLDVCKSNCACIKATMNRLSEFIVFGERCDCVSRSGASTIELEQAIRAMF
jgi:hypothetical protein